MIFHAIITFQDAHCSFRETDGNTHHYYALH